MGLLLLILLILLLLGAVPRHDWIANWGNGPAGLLVTIILILVILMLVGVIPHDRFNL